MSSIYLPPYLTDQEIDGICDPLTQPMAQIKYMRSLGMVVQRKPSGRALVAREEFKRVTVLQEQAAAFSPEARPDRERLLRLVGGNRHGAQTQK